MTPTLTPIAELQMLPTDYLLVAFEVRDLATNNRTISPPSRAACIGVMSRASESVEVAAIAWFADRELFECEDGKERLCSHFDKATGQWLPWVAEPLIESARWQAEGSRAGRRKKFRDLHNSEIGDNLNLGES